jgi:hypothetical protein
MGDVGLPMESSAPETLNANEYWPALAGALRTVAEIEDSTALLETVRFAMKPCRWTMIS